MYTVMLLMNFGELPPLTECVRVDSGQGEDIIIEAVIKIAGDQLGGGRIKCNFNPLFGALARNLTPLPANGASCGTRISPRNQNVAHGARSWESWVFTTLVTSVLDF